MLATTSKAIGYATMALPHTETGHHHGGLRRAAGWRPARFVLPRVAVLAGVALLAAAAAPAGAVHAPAATVWPAGAHDVSTMAEGSGGRRLTWASWTEGDPDHWVTRLVLIRRTARGVATTWGVRRPDGYGAVLRSTPWRRSGHPVLLLQYQFGAAYTRMELYAAAPDGRASLVGHLEGALIDVDRHGARETLRAIDNATLPGPQRCFRWNNLTGTLAATSCGPGEPSTARP